MLPIIAWNSDPARLSRLDASFTARSMVSICRLCVSRNTRAATNAAKPNTTRVSVPAAEKTDAAATTPTPQRCELDASAALVATSLARNALAAATSARRASNAGGAANAPHHSVAATHHVLLRHAPSFATA